MAFVDREAYYGDPDFADPIRYLDEAGGQMGDGYTTRVDGQRLANSLWQINVVGEGPGGSRVRMEVAELKVMTTGY